ncbi:MAG: glycosyltransferase family 4 protein [Bdellovibrionales bacterium]|nr:glycosyltransferase family 4 protein [Bdellovibrionales bacterium]
MKLVIVTNTPHYRVGECLYAYGPYAREIDIWADLFTEVLIVAPCRWDTPPTSNFLAFTKSNILILPQKDRSYKTFIDHISFFLNLPKYFLSLSRALQKGEAILIRCPGWSGFLGAVLAPLFTKYLIAKYAGQWHGYVDEPFSWRLQRFILRSWWWRKGLVMVYGEWPDQPTQIIPFFTSTMTTKQVWNGTEAARHKRLSPPFHILFVGRLISEKGVDILLRAANILLKWSIPFKLSLVGDGPDRNRLVWIVERLELVDHVEFVGDLPYDEVMSWYEKAHMLVLPSQSEGWPKVLGEAMCYGLVCIGTDRGLMPWLLKERGFVVPYGDEEALAVRMRCILEDPIMYQNLSKAASNWAQKYSIEEVKEALSRLLKDRWSYEFFKLGYKSHPG